MVWEQGKGHCVTEPPPPHTHTHTHTHTMVSGTGKGEKEILFYFRDEANKGTGIPYGGIITDLPNSN